MYEIVDHFIDTSGVYFVRFVVDETQAMYLTFKEMPTQEEVTAAAIAHFENQKQEALRMEQKRLDDLKALQAELESLNGSTR